MDRRLLLASLAVAAACTTRPVNTLPPAASAPAAMPVPPQAGAPEPRPGAAAPKSAVDLVDRLGDSAATAVPVPKDAPNEGIDFQNNWIFDRYGRFRREKWAIAQAEGRHYKVITVELADHTFRTIYFDITEGWNAWQPTTTQPH